jgi:hypothetical protein
MLHHREFFDTAVNAEMRVANRLKAYRAGKNVVIGSHGTPHYYTQSSPREPSGGQPFNLFTTGNASLAN